MISCRHVRQDAHSPRRSSMPLKALCSAARCSPSSSDGTQKLQIMLTITQANTLRGRWHQSCSDLVRSCPRRVWHHCRSPFKRDLLCKKHRSSDCLSERACTPTRKRKQARALPHTACRRQISPVVLHLKKLRASLHCDGDLFCFCMPENLVSM